MCLTVSCISLVYVLFCCLIDEGESELMGILREMKEKFLILILRL